jgi:hypothetical protein
VSAVIPKRSNDFFVDVNCIEYRTLS